MNEKNIIFLDKSYNLDTLGEALKSEFNNPEQVVRLSAEKTTPLQSVINLMDVVRGAGFERVFVATEPVTGP